MRSCRCHCYSRHWQRRQQKRQRVCRHGFGKVRQTGGQQVLQRALHEAAHVVAVRTVPVEHAKGAAQTWQTGIFECEIHSSREKPEPYTNIRWGQDDMMQEHQEISSETGIKPKYVCIHTAALREIVVHAVQQRILIDCLVIEAHKALDRARRERVKQQRRHFSRGGGGR